MRFLVTFKEGRKKEVRAKLDQTCPGVAVFNGGNIFDCVWLRPISQEKVREKLEMIKGVVDVKFEDHAGRML